MIDVTIVTCGDKSYSVKYSFEKISSEDIGRLKILSVNNVSKNSNTSFTRLNSVFERQGDTKFNTNKYKAIFEKLLEHVSRKYMVKNIQYA